MFFQIKKKKSFFLHWFFAQGDDDGIFWISLINNNEADVIYRNEKYKTYFIFVYLQLYDRVIFEL